MGGIWSLFLAEQKGVWGKAAAKMGRDEERQTSGINGVRVILVEDTGFQI